MIRILGSKVYISVFAAAFLVIISFSVDAVYLYIALLCALIHEIFHIMAMKALGARIQKISVYPCGADIRADLSGLTLRAEIIIALSGPFANALLSLISLFFVIYGAGIYVLAFLVSNLALFLVNIFPIKGLDGGRVIFAVLLMKYDIGKAYRIFDIISTSAFGALCFLALWLLYASGYNLSLVMVCVYLFISEYARKRMAESG